MQYFTFEVKYLAFFAMTKAKKYNRIKIVLAEKEVTNRALAEKLGLAEGSVSRWATNTSQPDVKTLFQIAEVLGVDVCELLNREPE